MSKEKEAIESILDVLSSEPEMIDIFGYREIQKADNAYVLATKKGDILLDLAEITLAQYASPITTQAGISGRIENLIHMGSGEKPWAIDPGRLEPSIQRQIALKMKRNRGQSDYALHWLLIFSTSAYPQVETCVRGISKAGSALTTARDYLSSLDQVIYDHIWYTNMMTPPVQVWPYRPGAPLCQF